MKVDDISNEESPTALLDKQQIANNLDEWQKMKNVADLVAQVQF